MMTEELNKFDMHILILPVSTTYTCNSSTAVYPDIFRTRHLNALWKLYIGLFQTIMIYFR